jgi:multidrug efflux pump
MSKENTPFEPQGLIYAVIRKRVFTVFFVLIITVLGLYCYYLIPKQESPDVTAPMALITTVYPGASPVDVEKLVTRPLEDTVLEINGYKESKSYSRNSISILVLELDNEAKVDKAWTDLRRRVEDIQNELPAECYATEIDTNLAETAGMIICLSGSESGYEQLASLAENMKRELARIPGVSRFEVKGVQDKVVQVKVNIAKLNHYDLSLEDLYNLLKVQNMEIPSGAIDTGEMKINVNTPGIFSSLSDIENTIVAVSQETGALVRLKDIATIDWEREESAYRIKNNGENAILLAGYFREDKNIVHIGQDVRKKLNELQKNIPPGIEMSELTFQPEEVSQAVNSFFLNLLGGMVLVLIVVFVGMGLKNALVASVAVPLSILIAFIAMYFTGIKVHEVSIASLIIALGILVDNAIVVIDAIQNYREKGMEKLEACLKGTRESILPIFAATLVTTVAFAPILIVPGAAGDYMRSIPYMLGFSLFASFAIAVLVTPVMAYIFDEKFPSPSSEKESKVRRYFEKNLDRALKYKRRSLILVLVIFALSFSLLKFIPLQFFPLADKNLAYIDLNAEKTVSIERTEMLAAQVEKFLSEQPEVSGYTTSVGDGLPKFYLTIPRGTPSQDYAQIMFKVNPAETSRYANLKELAVGFQEELDRTLVEGKATVNLLQKAYPGAPIEVRILGEDRERLKQLSDLYTTMMKELPGTINVEADADSALYEFLVDVDSDRAANLGITKYDIQRQINIALKGSEASVYRKAGNEYPIIVKSDLKSKEELENLAIKSSFTGSKVLLKQFAEVKLDAAFPSIKKYDGQQCITVTCYLEPGYSAVETEKVLKEEANRQIQGQGIDTSGIEILYQGEAKDIVDNFSDLGVGAIFGIFAIYIILMLQFGSFKQPLIIFTTIPLSLIGIFLGLFIFRQPLSFTALIGCVALMGLVIKNGILLIEYMNNAIKRGEDLEAACRGALKRRYRPIILSSVTTVFGLIPLVLSGSTLFMPLSVALMSGLLVSTLLTLIFIPLLYALIGGKKKTKIIIPEQTSLTK